MALVDYERLLALNNVKIFSITLHAIMLPRISFQCLRIVSDGGVFDVHPVDLALQCADIFVDPVELLPALLLTDPIGLIEENHQHGECCCGKQIFIEKEAQDLHKSAVRWLATELFTKLKRASGIVSCISQLFLDTQQLIVFSHAIRAGGRAGLDLSAAQRNRQIGDR